MLRCKKQSSPWFTINVTWLQTYNLDIIKVVTNLEKRTHLSYEE